MPSPATLFKDISAGRFKPAYYFYGSEDYRISEAEKFVANQFLPHRQMTTNFYRIDGRRTNAAGLIAELSNLPMLGEKQVFAVRDFQSYKPAEVTGVLELLSPPDPNRIVIFSSPSSRTPRKTSTFFSAVARATEAVEFRKLTPGESAGQVKARLKKEGLTADPDALSLLVELVGGSKGALEAELAKLIDFKAEGENITVEDIKRICSGYEVFRIFDLADHVVAGNTRKVLQMTRSLLSEGNSATTLVALLQQHFTSLYLVKNGKNPVGRRGFMVPRLKTQAGRYDNEKLEAAILLIAEADVNLRHKGIEPETTLEMLALTLAGDKTP
ncbi:MAG: DNA polymerase III subunit delta [Candidatus Zixiibacteriota bacterium]|nr:MAG: DNA polymerase III subunit delta [candidate division Zixibacteria bacterium]